MKKNDSGSLYSRDSYIIPSGFRCGKCTFLVKPKDALKYKCGFWNKDIYGGSKCGECVSHIAQWYDAMEN